MKKFFLISGVCILTILLIGTFYIAHAGSLTPPALPANTMYTFTDLFNLASGVTGTLGSGVIPTTPVTPTGTFQTITSAYTALSTQIALLAPTKLATGTSAFGITGTLLGDTTAANVLTTALHPGTFNPTNITTGNVKNGVTFGVSGGQTGTDAGLPTHILPATDQTICYTSTGTVTSCTGTGQDANLLKGVARSYTDNGNGTITDNVTGLVWQKCSDGQTGSDCSGGAVTGLDWTDALTYCSSNTAGLSGSGWYLPNYNQLFTLLDLGASSAPYINQTYFPNTDINSYYWSSSTFPALGDEFFAWSLTFADFISAPADKATSLTNVRCVRG
jgi:hypothetical protein